MSVCSSSLPLVLIWVCFIGVAARPDAVVQAAHAEVEITGADLQAMTGLAIGSGQDADAVVKAVEEAVAGKDAAALHNLIDPQQFCNRVLAGLDVKGDSRASFEKLLQPGGGFPMPREIIAAVEAGGDYRFVRHVKKGGETRPIFRLLLPNAGGINYHELIVVRDAAEESRIADIYVHLSGELLSQTLRRLVLPAFAAENNGLLAKLTGREAAMFHNFSILQNINQRNAAKDFPEAYRLISTLPPQLQKDKAVLLLKLLIAQQLGEDEYVKVIRELDEAFPNDPARDFRSIDNYATHGNHEKLVEVIDRLITAIGDPYLNYLKVDALASLGRMDDARTAIETGRTSGVDVIDAHWIELTFLLKAKNHAAVAKMLDTISEKFGVEFGDLTKIPEYADFVTSPQGKAWIRTQLAVEDR